MLTNVSFFVQCGDESYRLDLARGCSVNKAKLELTDYVKKVPINEMVLTFEGKQLKNTRTLSDYNIQEGSVLFLSRDRKVFFLYLFVCFYF